MNLKCKINIFIVLKPAVSEAKNLIIFLAGGKIFLNQMEKSILKLLKKR